MGTITGQVAFKGILLATILFLFSSMIPISTAYTVGVSTGKWVQYGDINYNLAALSGLLPYPSPKVDWLNSTVQSISGTNVTLQITGHLSNGTERNEALIGNVTSTGGNLTVFIIPANLNKNDVIPSLSPYRITDTLTRTYAGAMRSVNLLNLTISGEVANLYWDKSTGMLLDYYANTTSVWASFKVVATNLWGAVPIFPSSQVLVGILLTAIATHTLGKRKH